MSSKTITVDVRRGRRESGQVISAVALAPSGRILGIVDVVVPLMPGFKISERVGQAGEDAIISAAKDLALRVAEAVEAEPGQQG
jgi:hypothetical protein